MFNGRRLCIATKHEKEKVLAPVLEKNLGVHCYLVQNFDTDELGTFTGEVERKANPLTIVRDKCLKAMEVIGCDLAIANEGSFGPHPSLFFIPSDDEIIILIDKKNDLEIIVRELSTDTNFNGAEIRNQEELKEFALNAKFPSHGLICKKSKSDFAGMVKGISDWDQLYETFCTLIHNRDSVYVETDMRAMYNPTRMEVIGKAGQKLVDKIMKCCPICKTPGFGITDVKEGLPCELCHFPTRSVLSYIHSCQKCGHTKEEMFPNGKFTQDPMYCDMCNP